MAFDAPITFETAPDVCSDRLSRLLGARADLAECGRLGRNLIQALLIAPKRTAREAQAAEQLTAFLGVLLPVLEEPIPEDSWDDINGAFQGYLADKEDPQNAR